jgi:hypothetical protein
MTVTKPSAEASVEAVRVALDTLVAHIVERETYVGGPEQDAFHNANVVPAEHALDRALSALSASQAAMREALTECADELEAEVKAHYTGSDGKIFDQRRYDRDMGPVTRARAVLAARASATPPAGDKE